MDMVPLISLPLLSVRKSHDCFMQSRKPKMIMASVREGILFSCSFCFFVPTPRKPPSPFLPLEESSPWVPVSPVSKCPFFGAFFLQQVILWTSGRRHPIICSPFSSLVNSPFILFMFSGLLLRALSLPASWFNSSTFLHQRASTPPLFPLLPAFKGQDQRSSSPVKLWQIPRLARTSLLFEFPHWF